MQTSAEIQTREPSAQGSRASEPKSESPGMDPAQLTELFERHHRRVFRAAYRVTGDAGDAEDALQTVFLRLARRSQGLDPSGAGAYLHRAGIRAALDLLRSRKRSPSVPLEEDHPSAPATGEPGPERGSLSAELRRELRRGLARLKPRAAEIFTLRYLEGHRNRDIADLLGISPTAVAVTLHRTRAKLQKELEPLRGGST